MKKKNGNYNGGNRRAERPAVNDITISELKAIIIVRHGQAINLEYPDAEIGRTGEEIAASIARTQKLYGRGGVEATMQGGKIVITPREEEPHSGAMLAQFKNEHPYLRSTLKIGWPVITLSLALAYMTWGV